MVTKNLFIRFNVCLPNQGEHVQPNYQKAQPQDMNNCFVGGWGATSQGGPQAEKLQTLAVQIFSDAYCNGFR